jgi:lycopene beta-cyclase
MVEATVFSKEVLEEGAYVRLLQDYLQVHYPAMEYRIIEEEYGVIPMTSHHFPVAEGRIVYLGTAGGQTKASTGYTFMPIQRHSAQLTQSLIVHDHPYIRHKKSAARFRLYDRILLHLLANNLLAGDQIFKRLFEQNSPQAIFRFLDNASTLPEELKLTMTLQKGIFIKAALKEIFPAPDF